MVLTKKSKRESQQYLKQRPLRSKHADKFSFFGEKGNNYFDKKRRRIEKNAEDARFITLILSQARR